MEAEERHRHDVHRRYEGDGFVVHWEPPLCIHTGNCFRRLPRAFDPRRRPWIVTDGISLEEATDAVRRCPTGALRLERTDGLAAVPPQEPAAVITVPDGPLYVIGELEVVDVEGKTVRRASRLALCRCGASNNKPYCDNTHLRLGFRA